MNADRNLGANFAEFFGAMRVLNSYPRPHEMWEGFRELGVVISPTTVGNWTKGRGYPSDRFKSDLMEVFDLTESEFAALQAGSRQEPKHLYKFTRTELIGALIADVIYNPPLTEIEGRQLGALLLNHSTQPAELE